MASERKVGVHFDPVRRSFVQNGIVLKGLLNVLADVFYPAFSKERAVLGIDTSAQRRPPRVAKVNKLRGELRGKLVDDQLTEIARYHRRLRLPVEFWLATKIIKPIDIPDLVWASILQLRERLHPWSKALLRELLTRHLQPVAAQVAVVAQGIKVATAVDCIVVEEKTQQVAIIDWKCGFEGNYEKHTARNMSEPFSDKVDSYHNQNQLQLIMTLTMYAFTYHGQSQDSAKQFIAQTPAYIFRAHGGKQVTVYPLEDWARQSYARIILYITRHFTHIAQLKVLGQGGIPPARASRIRTFSPLATANPKPKAKRKPSKSRARTPKPKPKPKPKAKSPAKPKPKKAKTKA